jgi:small subunit ribosomal protein S23
LFFSFSFYFFLCHFSENKDEMPRHHSILVHKQISAQLAGGLLKRAPRGYPALVSYPPHPTPPQDPHGNSHHRKRKLAPIRFEAKDRLRRAFFRDHPFEAYRPVSLLELDPRLLLHKATRDLSNCHRLDQISCRPSPEELSILPSMKKKKERRRTV